MQRAAPFPAWLERTAPIAPDRLASLAFAAHVAEPSKGIEAAAQSLRYRILDFLGEVGLEVRLGALEVRLGALGVSEADILDLVGRIEGALANDPGPVASGDLVALYRASL